MDDSGNELVLGAKTAVVWIFVIYLVHTIGELCLSPVGLSSVTKLSPQRIVGVMMGMWFLASAAGNFLAGIVATSTSSEEYRNLQKEFKDLGQEGYANIPYTEIEKIGFVDAYTAVGWGAIGFSILLMLLSPLLVKMMHGIK